MECTVPVNEMLQDDITQVNYTLTPAGYQAPDIRSLRAVQESLAKIINHLGEQSASAQGLSKVITTADKLRNAPGHVVYLLKDAEAKGGAGDVVGLLKVARKRLFLFDEKNTVCEVEPVCVMDFFVQREYQRRGHGRALFDHMLRDVGLQPRQLAVDGPSYKMERFLAKNYGLERLLHQNNNFAVAHNFFDNLQPESESKSLGAAAAPAPVGRYAATKRRSTVGNLIHGGGSGFQDDSSNRRHGENSVNTLAELPEPESGTALPALDTPLDTSPEPPPEPAPVVVPSRPSSLCVEPLTPAAGARTPVTPVSRASPDGLQAAGAGASRRDSQLTDQGYFDVKFYHNKLW